MIITIDGPAGAGKSTVAKFFTAKLSGQSGKILGKIPGKIFEYLDTGSMYRAVALLGLRRKVDWNVPPQLEQLAENASIDVIEGRTYLDGEDVTDAVRSPEVTEKTKFAADNPVIRLLMVKLQQAVAAKLLQNNRGLVTEGRDQGTAVFPDAPLKIFLTATPEERAKRRLGELQQRGKSGNYDEILQSINQRDQRDSARSVGPMREPEDAVRVVTDGMTIDHVVERLVQLYCERA